ncbi:MAG TPA: glutaredoxin [Cyanobacteria bacterium UBA11991]|nr:glutathione S-transferase N-terminal domain-containing protein [Cyanobacteriota bacterium]MDY6357991.1 glutathione S-transferase N-terminal domain-containing protein [Cyanobacteriota bacterium]MDY6364309.1 glutathione S-transferase N-terminal domain-containing protein [Cyanobacteriota bacterium]MDY6383623.1 glutathione S-transferase N-terminal domain-containing protein [Cyanobacteriota bacterium]HCB10934.1 glutaredoxin [Cyanobacteria bacterium UBA11991]
MIELYMLETCPYCKKVLNYLNENNFKYITHNIKDKNKHDKLIELGGKEQVPFLYDNVKNIKMYESDDIIAYLKSLKGHENE